MAFAYSTSIQNRISLLFFGGQYSTLDADQKIALDGTWTTGSLTTGAAFDALTRITQIANWFEMAGATSAPQAWEHWLVQEVCFILAPVYRPERLGHYAQQREVAIDEAIDAFTNRDPTGTFASTNDSQKITVQGLRYYVLNACARRKESGTNTGLRRRIFPPIDLIDSEIYTTINELWNTEFWSFRKREVTIQIGYLATVTAATWTETTKTLTQASAFTNLPSGKASSARVLITDGTGVITGDFQVVSKTSNNAIVLADSISTANADLSTGDITACLFYVDMRGLLSGETYDAMASRQFFYAGSQYGARLRWADSTAIESGKASIDSSGGAQGMPCMFRTEQQPVTATDTLGAMTWHLIPFPDQSYTLKGSVWVKGPGTPSSVTDTAVFGRFPTEFGPVIREMVLARVLLQMGASDGERLWSRAVEKVGSLLPSFTDQGAGTRQVSVSDEYQDRSRQIGTGYPSGGLAGWGWGGGGGELN